MYSMKNFYPSHSLGTLNFYNRCARLKLARVERFVTAFDDVEEIHKRHFMYHAALHLGLNHASILLRLLQKATTFGGG